MKPMRTQPYFKYAMDNLPASSELAQAVAEYLGMRLHKDNSMHAKVWEACIDELVKGMRLDKMTSSVRSKTRVIGSTPIESVIPDLIYLFQTATLRRWNRVFFTRQQDADWNNVSFYQDPYWSRVVRDATLSRILQEELNGKC